jgi:hypothetical protein
MDHSFEKLYFFQFGGTRVDMCYSRQIFNNEQAPRSYIIPHLFMSFALNRIPIPII